MFKFMGQLLQWAPELKSKFFLAAIFKVLEGVFMGAPYVFIYLTLDSLVTGTLDTGKIIRYTGWMAACFLLQGISNYFFNRMIWPSANDMIKKLRIMIGEHLRRLSMGYFSRKTTGSLNTLVADEMLAIQTALHNAFPDYIVAFVFLLVIPACLLFLDWRLALITVAVIPLAAPFYVWNRNTYHKNFRKRSAVLARLNAEAIDHVQGIEVLKLFNQTGGKRVKFDKVLKAFRTINIKAVLRGDVPMTLGRTVLDLGICLIMLFAIIFLFAETLSMSIFLLFLIMSLRIYAPIRPLILAVAILKMAEPAVSKIKDLLETPALPQRNNGPPPTSFDVQFRNVGFSYGETPVLNDVSFTVPENSITALVGPSGSGKTTITRLIARFWDIDSGTVRIGGRDIRDMEIETLLSLVSMVFQDVYLFNDTIYQNIAYGSRSADRAQIIKASKMARCHEFISELPDGYDTMVGEGGATLSGGEKQRISIARAILKDAPINLLDEATASVDPENEVLIQSAINSLVGSKTLIIIAHRLSTITTADQIVVLNQQGRVAEIGTHDTLLQKDGLYAQLWRNRIQAKKWNIV